MPKSINPKLLRTIIKFKLDGTKIESQIIFSNFVPETITYLSIFNSAKAYYYGGKRCITAVSNSVGTTESLTFPSLVNYLFSIELFLKALYLYEGHPQVKRGHYVEILFNDLSAESKKEIENRFTRLLAAYQEQIILARPQMVNYGLSPELLEKVLGSFDNIIALKFSAFLSVINNFFVNVRYDYERKQDVEYMDTPIFIFATVLFEYFQKIVPSILTRVNP